MPIHAHWGQHKPKQSNYRLNRTIDLDWQLQVSGAGAIAPDVHRHARANWQPAWPVPGCVEYFIWRAQGAAG